MVNYLEETCIDGNDIFDAIIKAKKSYPDLTQIAAHRIADGRYIICFPSRARDEQKIDEAEPVC